MRSSDPLLSLFIDTNVFLSFFHYTSDALDHLERLADMAKSGEVRLLVPDQVRDEFYRDRDIRLSDALKRLGDSKISGQYPNAFRDDEEYEDLRRLESQFGQMRLRIIARFQKTAGAGAFKADEVIQRLFDAAIRIGVDEGILQAADLRRRRGNPPGKKDSLGDQINWEALLSQSSEGDMYIVSGDRDWRTPLDERRIHPFLDLEWKAKAGGSVHLYEDISSFFADKIPALEVRDQPPDISSGEEAEKNRLIAALRDSPSFQTTHSIIAQLDRFTDFTTEQLNLILIAYITNAQVSQIIADSDVMAFLLRALQGRDSEVDQQLVRAVARLVEGAKE
jgi:hypothetical protein